MEIAEINPANQPNEAKEEKKIVISPEEMQMQFEKQLRDGYDECYGVAQMYYEKSLGQWFTSFSLSKIMDVSSSKIESELKKISKYYFVEQKEELNMKKFKICMNDKTRLEYCQQNGMQLQSKLAINEYIGELIYSTMSTDKEDAQ